MDWLVFIGVVGLALFIANKHGKKVERISQLEETLEDVKESQELDARMSSKSFRDKLRAYAKKNDT